MRTIPSSPTLTVAAQTVKIGDRTRGRGFWVARDRSNRINPDVDHPSAKPVSDLEGDESTSSDGFNDSKEPFSAMWKPQSTRHIARNQVKAAEAFYQTYQMSTKSEAEMTPITMTPQDLMEATEVLKGLLASCKPEDEAELRAQARELSKAIKRLLGHPELLQKAGEAGPPSSKEPAKAESKKLSARGKVVYDYGAGDDLRANKKGVNSDSALPGVGQKNKGQAAQSPPQDSGTITPPVTSVDPTPFLSLLKLPINKLQDFAKKHTKQSFVDWFTKLSSRVTKPESAVMFTPAYLGQLYDTLISPPPPSQPAQGGQPGAGPAPKAPGNATPRMTPEPAAKSVKFNWPVVDPRTVSLSNRLQKAKVASVDDVRKCLKDWFFYSDETARRIGDEVLNRWSKMGVVTLS